MQLSHTRPVASAVFDDPNLVSCAGLVPMAALAQKCGLAVLVDEHLSVPTDKGSNAGAKVSCLVAGMVGGADSIDDMALLRHGAMGTVFDRPYAPWTLGSFLREFAFGHVHQLDCMPACCSDCMPAHRCWPGSTARCASTWTTPSSKCTATPTKDPDTATPGSAD